MSERYYYVALLPDFWRSNCTYTLYTYKLSTVDRVSFNELHSHTAYCIRWWFWMRSIHYRVQQVWRISGNRRDAGLNGNKGLSVGGGKAERGRSYSCWHPTVPKVKIEGKDVLSHSSWEWTGQGGSPLVFSQDQPRTDVTFGFWTWDMTYDMGVDGHEEPKSLLFAFKMWGQVSGDQVVGEGGCGL
jgi:hypothetical protein